MRPRKNYLPARYLTSKPYPTAAQGSIKATPSFVGSYFHQIFYSYSLTEAVKVTPSYVSGSMALIDFLEYQTYDNAAPEAVKVTPSYVSGSMQLIDFLEYNTYNNAQPEAVKVTPSYVPGSMSLPTVVQYITYNDADVEAVKVTPSYVAGSMIIGLTTPTITTQDIPEFIADQANSFQMSVGGGTAPYTWSVDVLPAGLSMDTSGLITGMPNVAGHTSSTFTVNDSASQTDNKTLPVDVVDFVVNGFYSIPVAATVSGTHTDFPVYVKPSAISGLGTLTQAQADSARFYSDQAKTNELAREIVSADEIHVKADSLDSSTVLYMDIDGARADYADTDPFGAQAAWGADFEAVYHLESLAVSDATANGNDGDNHGLSLVNDGALGKALDFRGNAYSALTQSGIGSLTQSDFTVSIWFKSPDTEDHTSAAFSLGIPSQWSNNLFILYIGDNANQDIRIWWEESLVMYTGNDIYDNQWHQATLTKAGQTLKLFLDGVFISSAQTNANTWTSSSASLGAANNNGVIKHFYNALMDEVHAVKAVRSANWIATEYANQNDPSTFFGTATTV